MTLNIAISLLLGYLFGSVPFGLLLTRLYGHGDIRRVGSGNIGATNVLRVGGRLPALLTLALDAGKGALAVLLTAHVVGDGIFPLLAGLAAVLGHNFPIWLRFRGGKGVATSLAALTALFWPVGLIACALWLITAAIFRTSSLAALIALAGAPITALFFGGVGLAALATALFLLSVVRHHRNIRRLLAGTEPRIGESKSP